MKPSRFSPTLLLSLVTALGLSALGCAASGAPEANAPGSPRELNRADAIASARQDAASNYGDGWGGEAQAQLAGGYWVIELHAKTGYRLRYAISAHDGTIRERSMAQ
jgi:hypothetical protein